MNRAGQLFSEYLVDAALARDTGQPVKGARHNQQSEVRFPFGTGAGVTGVQMRLIDDVEF